MGVGVAQGGGTSLKVDGVYNNAYVLATEDSAAARARLSSFVNTAMGSWSAVLGIYAVSPKATTCPFVVERTHFAGAELGASCWVASASRIGRRDVDMSVAVAAAAAASKRRVILAVGRWG